MTKIDAYGIMKVLGTSQKVDSGTEKKGSNNMATLKQIAKQKGEKGKQAREMIRLNKERDSKIRKYEKKEVAKAVLNGLAQVAERPKDKKGNLDVAAFNELPEVKKAVKRLREVGINRKWLFNNGFQIAGFILTFAK